MHGKIVTFQDATGKGVVINHFKKLFSFSRATWHDPKALPTKGLLVEYRADNDQILDIHASRYQDFSDSLVSEHEFWQTETDDELADKEEKKRSTTSINQPIMPHSTMCLCHCQLRKLSKIILCSKTPQLQ